MTLSSRYEGEVLEDEFAGVVGIVPLELINVMAETTGNVDDQRCIGFGTGEQLLLYGIDLWVMPWQAPLPVATHCECEKCQVSRKVSQ